jgi:hypothetical protein
MKKVSTEAAKQSRKMSEQKLTVGLDLGDPRDPDTRIGTSRCSRTSGWENQRTSSSVQSSLIS